MRLHLPQWLRVVPGLAGADLRHEWVLTLCLAIAIAAVIAPLLLLQGLRQGTIATLRERLVQDPVYREIRPAQTREYPPQWFDQWSRVPGVQFLLPTILPASSIIGALDPRSGKLHTLDLIPTAAGDPLLLDNAVPIPGPQECVLTGAAAAALGVKAGDHIQARATRSRGGLREYGEARLRVAAVLPPRGGTLPRVYAPLSFVLDVEAYKEGRAIPQRRWSGDTARPYPSFDALILLLAHDLDPITRTGLIINTGVPLIEPLDAEGVRRRLGFAPPPDWNAYLLSVPNGTVSTSNLEAVTRKLRGLDAILLPCVDPIELALGGTRVQALGLSLDPGQARRLGVHSPPWGGLELRADDFSRLGRVLLPAGSRSAQGEILEAVAPGITPLRFALRVAGESPSGFAYLAAELAGILRTAQARAVAFEGGELTMARGGYRGFRLYARTIDDVPALASRLREAGVEVIAQVDAIQRIQVLDRGLARLLWLVASLGVSGGAAVLVASLYAAVQRKRRDLAVLRLVGLRRRDVFFFPLSQGLALAVMGIALSLLAYGVLARIINDVFSGDLDLGQRICALNAHSLAQASLAVAGIALLSSLLAAAKATRIDPAEAIREE